MFCFVLFCFVLFCFVLFCFVLFCFVLFFKKTNKEFSNAIEMSCFVFFVLCNYTVCTSS